jgi:hypothetical protein
MTAERRRALADLLDEIAYRTQFRDDDLDGFDDDVLAGAIEHLGIDEVGELIRDNGIGIDLLAGVADAMALAENAATAGARPPSPTAAARRKLEQFLIERLRGAEEHVEALLRALDWRLEPAIMGRSDVPTDPPTGIHATLLGDYGHPRWETARLLGPGAVSIQGVGAAGELTSAVTACAPEAGGRARVAVDAEALAGGDRRGAAVFYVVGGERGWRDDTERELIVLLRPDRPGPGRGAGRYHPAASVRGGYLAQGWEEAIAHGFVEEELLALQALIWPRMRLLLEEVASDDPDVVRDVRTVRGLLDARQHQVVRRILALF